MVGVKSFRKILKRQYPEYYDRISVSINQYSNYSQFLGVDGRTRAELNYNSQHHKVVISFPGNSGNLYPDISSFIRIIWGGKVDVMATFDSCGTNHFEFKI
jgi:hypothetical protein